MRVPVCYLLPGLASNRHRPPRRVTSALGGRPLRIEREGKLLKTTVERIRPEDHTEFIVACLAERLPSWKDWRPVLGPGDPRSVVNLLNSIFARASRYFLVLLGRAHARVPTAVVVLEPSQWGSTYQVYLFVHPRHATIAFTPELWPGIEAEARRLKAHRIEFQVAAEDEERFLSAIMSRLDETGLTREGIQKEAVPKKDKSGWQDLHLFAKVLGGSMPE